MNPENLNIDDITTLSPTKINKESQRYCVIPIKHEKDKPLSLKFEARMKIFKHSSEKTDSYSLGITIPEELENKFKEIEQKINILAKERQTEVKKLNNNFGDYHVGDFHLLKSDKSENPKIYAKLYVDRFNPLNSSATFYRVVDVDGRKKKEKVKNNLELEGIPLNGIVVVNVKQLFCANIKALTCVVQEVLIKEEIHPQSAFDEYEDEE